LERNVLANQAAVCILGIYPRMDAANVSKVMITRQILAMVPPTLARSVRRWIFHLRIGIYSARAA